MLPVNYRETLKIFFEESKTQHLTDEFLADAFNETGVRLTNPANADEWVEYRFLHKTVEKVDHLFIRIAFHFPKRNGIQAWDIFNEGKRYSWCDQEFGKKVGLHLNQPSDKTRVPPLVQLLLPKAQLSLGNQYVLSIEPIDLQIKQVFAHAKELLAPPTDESSKIEVKKKVSPVNPILLISGLALIALLYLAAAYTKGYFPFRPAATPLPVPDLKAP